MNDIDYIRLKDKIRDLENKLNDNELQNNIKNYIKSNLTILVSRQSFYKNNFTIKLLLEGEEISVDYFEAYTEPNYYPDSD